MTTVRRANKRDQSQAAVRISDRTGIILAAFAALASVTPAVVSSASLSYSSHLGGVEDDQTRSLVVAPNGDRVFCGNAESTELATAGALQPAPAGGTDIIVGRYAADDKSLVFLTYFGGTGEESCNRIALDSAGDIVFVGKTASPDFPTVNAQDDSYAGSGTLTGAFEGDGFVAKIRGDGSTVVFSTFLGGVDLDSTQPDGLFGRETIRGLAIDSDDRIVVVGNTAAPDFPATSVLGDGECGMDALPPVNSRLISDQFVARYQPDGNQDFAVCISGDARDAGRDVTLDDSGSIYVVGHTRSTNYPTTLPGIGTNNGNSFEYEIVVTVLDADATQILRSVNIGGLRTDFAQNIRINSVGQLLVQGYSFSEDFPTTPGAWQPNFGQPKAGTNSADAVVLGVTSQLDELLFATFIGGPGDESSLAFALDGDRPVLSVSTGSRGLPVINPIQSDKSGDMGGFSPIATGNVVAFASFSDFFNQQFRAGFGVAGPGSNRVYTDVENNDEFELLAELPGAAPDPRDIVFADINADSRLDVLIGNYEDQNQLYLGNDLGQFDPPIAFGDAQSKTTALGVPQAGCVIEFVQDGVNLQHPYLIDFGNPLVYGAGNATVSLDVVEFSDYLLEISAPDELTLYRGCAQPGVSPVLETAVFAGRQFVKADLAELDDVDGPEAALADQNGGGMVLLNVLDDGLSASTIDFAGPPSNAIAISRSGGVVTAHDTMYRYYRLTSPTTLVLDTEQMVATPANALLTFDSAFSDNVLSGSVDGIAEAQVVEDAEDLYLIRLSPDLSDATLATYLGGPGEEFGNFGVDVVAPGEYVFTGSTQSAGFPVTLSAQQAMTGGRQDGVFVELDLGESDLDIDEDGVPDVIDNCTLIANPDQRDTNGDGFGNVCDPDFDNDNIVNVLDLGLLRAAFFGAPGTANWNPDADLNGDDIVNAADLGILRAFFFAPPGPAGAINRAASLE
ncbi:MAG: thrombospondin type 3 repeat-containing protein [Gammaproteobacteria bacterium]